MIRSGLVAWLLLLALPSLAAPAMRAQVGLGGYARTSWPAPVTVDVDNPAGVYEGVLQAESTYGRPRATAGRLSSPGASPGVTAPVGTVMTAMPVSLAGGARKRYVAYLPVWATQPYNPTVTVAVRLRSGRQVDAQQPVTAKILDDTRLLVVSCTGESGGLRFLDERLSSDFGWRGRAGESRGGPTHVVDLNPADFPAHAADLQAADLLLLSGRAWQQLQPAQRRAARMWVEAGGRLLACGESGAPWKDEEARSLLPVEPAGSLSVREVTALRGLGAPPLRPAGGGVLLAAGSARPGAAVAAREGPVPLLVSAPRGFGSVTWLGLDPFRSTVRGWPGFEALWDGLMRHTVGAAARRPRLGQMEEKLDTAKAASEMLPPLHPPSRPALVVFALLYALIFGPVNIWFLRRLRRTVRAWLFVPALSLGMTAVLLTAGHAWGRGQAMLNRVSVTEVMSGARTGWQQELVGLFSPTNRTFDLASAERGTRLARVGTGDEEAPEGPATLVPTVQSEAGARWEDVPFTLWFLQQFRLERVADLGGAVTLQLAADLSGSVQNDTPHRLEACRIVLVRQGQHRYELGTLEPGERHALRPERWERRRWDEAAGGTASPTPGAVPAGPFAAVQEQAALVLSLDSSTTGPEAILTARAPALAQHLQVSDLAGHNRADLLVVRAPVGRDGETGRRGDAETRRRGDVERGPSGYESVPYGFTSPRPTLPPSPRLRVPASPRPPLSPSSPPAPRF